MNTTLDRDDLASFIMESKQLNQLREELLHQPLDSDRWAQLFRLLGENNFTTVESPHPITHEELTTDHGSIINIIGEVTTDEGITHSESDDKLGQIGPATSTTSIEEIAKDAFRQLSASNQNVVVLSVDCGCITIGSIVSTNIQPKLLYAGKVSHVPVNETLAYRDPFNKFKITCITFQNILSSSAERSISEYVLDYGGEIICLSQRNVSLHSEKLRIHFESWDGRSLTGWAGYPEDLLPRQPIFTISLNGQIVQTLLPDIMRTDVLQALESKANIPTGFAIQFTPSQINASTNVIEFRDCFTNQALVSELLPQRLSVFDRLLRYNSPADDLNIVAGEAETSYQISPKRNDQSTKNYHQANKLDILIPVYKNWELTSRSIEAVHASVLRYKEAGDLEIYIHAVNDCSPEGAVNENMESFCLHHGIIFHSNPQNLGFIKTVNNFLDGTSGDVMLVNSDVIVDPSLVSEILLAKQNAGSNVASVTTFSNNATIYSHPFPCEENENVKPEQVGSIAQAFRQSSYNQYEMNGTEEISNVIRVPVSHGFLMFMTRTALNVIGGFDEYFGLGYGEEVDWAMRATLHGFEHYLCCSTYAFHKGSASFGPSVRLKAVENSNKIIASRYPYYDRMIAEYVDRDELRTVRNKASELLIAGSTKDLKFHLTHSSGGGIDKYIESVRAYEDQCDHLIVRPGRSYADLARQTHSDHDFSIECPDLAALIQGSLRNEGISLINCLHSRGHVMSFTVHSFVGWKTDEIKELMNVLSKLNIPYDITAHDYMMVCPRIKLIDSSGSYCSVGSNEECMHCLRTASPAIETSLLKPYSIHIDLYREFFSEILNRASCIKCSTEDQAVRFKKLGHGNTVVQEPYEPLYSLLERSEAIRRSKNVLLIGGISEEKGSVRLFNVASIALSLDPDLHFYVIGSVSNIDKMNNLQNFTHIGAYSTFNELFDLVKSIHDPVAFFPSLWPETWCYTLSEALALNLPILASDIGAIGSRLRGMKNENMQLYDNSLPDKDIVVILSFFCSGCH